MFSMAGYLIIILVAAVVIIAASVIAYNRRLDKITSGDLRDTHSTIPEPGTTVGAVYKIVLLVVVVISLLTVSTANGMLISMQQDVNNLNSRIEQLNREIRSLREQSEQAQTLIASSSWDIVSADYANSTAEVRFSATLKEYSDSTAATLVFGGGGAAKIGGENAQVGGENAQIGAENAQIGGETAQIGGETAQIGGETAQVGGTVITGREIPLEQTAPGVYAVTVNMNFFEEHTEPKLRVADGGRNYLETVDFPEYIFWDLLPMPGFECRFNSGMNFGKLKYDGSYTIDVKHLEDIESVTITYISGGRELKTIDFTKETLDHTWHELEEGLDVGNDLMFRTEIVTKTGFKIIEKSVMIYDSSDDIEDEGRLIIQDLDGNTLWEDEY